MRDITMIIFGDSIAFGANDYQYCGWANRLRLHINKTSDKYILVYNQGISGQTSGGLLNTFESECAARIKADEKKVILFAIGINDTQTINGEDRVKLEQFEDNINCLINKAKAVTENIIFVGLTPVDESKVNPTPRDKNKRFLNDKILKYDNCLSKVCEKQGCGYIKMFSSLSVNDLDDGVHPNSEGHEIIFKRVLQNLTKFI